MKKGKYRKGIFIVVYKKEKNKIKYLLLKRKLHWKGWEFPKGGCEAKETYRKCASREIKEETGHKPIKINWYCKQGKYKWKKGLEDRPEFIGQTYTLLSAEIKNKKIKFDKKEHSSYKWVDFDKALKLLTWPNQRSCLRVVNKHINL